MKALALTVAAVCLAGCGKNMSYLDAGDEDAGFDAGPIDAGRARGDDPPTGYTVAIELPADAGVTTRLVSASLALDQFNQPMVAAIEVDPNGDGVSQDNQVVFSRWNGTEKAWQTPQTVEVIGELNVDHPRRQLSLARNAESGQLGLVYVTAQNQVRFAYSNDEGAHWSEETVSAASADPLSNPVLAMKGDALHVAFLSHAVCAAGTCGKVIYRKRLGKAAFTDLEAPLGSSTGIADAPVAMALGPDGVASLAYFGDSSADDTVSLLWWNSSSSTASTIADSGNTKNDTGAKIPSVSIAFDGATPTVAYHLLNAASPAAQLWFARASDAQGNSWGTSHALPRNGSTAAPEGTQWYQAVVNEGAGKVAVVGDFAQASAPLQQCGGPKLGRAADGATFTVCHPPEKPASMRTFGQAGAWLSMASHAASKLTLSFSYENRFNPSLGNKAGVVVYREP